MKALIVKDLRILLMSPLAGVATALFLFLTAFAFNSQLVPSGGGELPEASMRGLIYFMAVVLMFIVPLLSMRAFAEEQRSKTYEWLRTSPLSDVQLVLAKFVAIWTLLTLMLAATLIFPGIMLSFAEPDVSPMCMAYLGLWLLTGSFVAVSIFASSLSHSPMISALLAFVMLLILWFAGGTPGVWGEELSIIRHLESFSIGVFDVSDTSYYVLFIAAFLFLTIRWQEALRWR